MLTKILSLTCPRECLIRQFFCFGLILIALYIYFVNQIVVGVVQRQKLSQQINELNTEVAQLETRYVALTGKITLELAHQLGFQDISNQTGFAYQN